MSDNSAIEWTDATWNPTRARYLQIQDDGSGKERIGWHCEHVSEGCRNCYAERINRRLGTGLDFKPGELYRPERQGYYNGESKLFLDEKMLLAPLKWKKPRMIFVCSMTDLFADFVPDEWLDKIFAVMALTPQHTYQVLTKRAGRMREYCTRLHDEPVRDTLRRICAAWPGNAPIPEEIKIPLPNVWLGVSAECQQEWDERTEHLRNTPAAIRFVSGEPLLGPIKAWFTDDDGVFRGPGYDDHVGIDWVIVGGESGPNARPMHPDWARSLRDQCAAAGVAFFFKQWGEYLPVSDMPVGSLNGRFVFKFADGVGVARVGKHAASRLLDGVEHNAMPRVPR